MVHVPWVTKFGRILGMHEFGSGIARPEIIWVRYVVTILNQSVP